VFTVQGEVVLDMIDEENLADRKVKVFPPIRFNPFQSVSIRSNPNQSVFIHPNLLHSVSSVPVSSFHTIQVKGTVSRDEYFL
jgi:hypothetical protein